MKTIKFLLAASVGLLMSASCSGSMKNNPQKETSNEKTEKMENHGKTLIVFFSHPGDNYSVGNIKVGNTKIVADYIKDATGADEFEVVAEKDYNMSYDALTKLAKKEQQDDERPAFKGEVKNIGQYDTIFIGTPIWWSTFPQVMFTFFDKYDLNGKTIIPFATHEGSGLGNIVEDLKTQYPNAKVEGAFSLYGHEVRTSKAKVEQWLKKLGF